MNQNPEHTLALLHRYKDGDSEAGQDLLPVVYSELRKIAGKLFTRERDNHTLQPTILVHDAFLNLVGQDIDWNSRKHFLRVAAKAMRRLLRDHARARNSEKRGGDWDRVTLVDSAVPSEGLDFDIEGLDSALEELQALNDRQASVVELRFFAELTIDETADALEVSTGTVENDWRFGRAWLLRRLGGSGAS